MKYNRGVSFLILFLFFCSLFAGCSKLENIPLPVQSETEWIEPEESEEAYVVVNDNEPYFTKEDLTTESFESYSDLDSLERCHTAFANIGQDLMPTEERESISQVKPSGWQSVKYDEVDGNYLYNRCHLIGFQLTGENANEKNLITGTRYMNVEGMLPFENEVADYVSETDNHVLYRVTPIYEGENLLADGVLMEAYSVEDEGKGVSFCVYVYNKQPGIEIDYKTGESSLMDSSEESGDEKGQFTYVLNTNTKKIHLPSCSSVKEMKKEYQKEMQGDLDELEKEGYSACKKCIEK